MSDGENRMNNIVNNLMDILISSVKMVGSYGRDLWDSVSPIWKDDHLSVREDDGMWNGGETFRIDDDENTPTPYDDDIVIQYDGIMDEVDVMEETEE